RVTAAREGAEAVVRVRDTGVGIGRDLLPRVFELFTQAERPPDRAQGGLGLGLTLVKDLVERHGGRVAAHSPGPDLGSEFTVRLPALPEGIAAAAPPAPAAAPGQTSRSRRVLVVDDNRDLVETLEMLLRHWGHQVRTAHDGLTVLPLARDFRPEVV